MKVGLEVRISLVSVLSTGGELPTPKKSFSCKKLNVISNTDHNWQRYQGISEGYTNV